MVIESTKSRNGLPTPVLTMSYNIYHTVSMTNSQSRMTLEIFQRVYIVYPLTHSDVNDEQHPFSGILPQLKFFDIRKR